MTKKTDQIKYNQLAHDRVADKYDNRHNEIYNMIEQKRLNGVIGEIVLLVDSKPIKVLDFGAGTGNLTRKFLSCGCQVTACDVSEKSLELLAKEIISDHLKIQIYDGSLLPFSNNTFDVVSTYSVLHHIPDYLKAVEELIRITNSGGLIYIDHEVNDNRWHIGHELKEYYDFTKKTFLRNTFTLIRSGQLFSPGFIKSFFVKRFVNKRYKREGDIHVWPDDHIEWDKIISVLEESCKIILQEDYLLYNPLVDFSIYKHYQKNATI